MMNARLNKALVALLAVATAGACDDAPVEPGNSDPARLTTNPTVVVVEAGATTQVQAYLVNKLGNPVVGDVSFAACGAGITVEADDEQSDLEPGTHFNVTGNTLGETCVNLSASGHEATVTVRVVPTAVNLTIADTVLSGSSSPSTIGFVGTAGTPVTGFDISNVTFSSLNEAVAVVDAQGNVTGQAPGEVGIVAALNAGLGAPRADTFFVEVVPGTFTGTITPAAGAGGAMTTAEFGATDPAFDESSVAQGVFGGNVHQLWALPGSDENTFVTRAPYGVAPTAGSLVLSGLGEAEVALAEAWEITAETNTDQYDPNSVFEGHAPAPITLPFNDVLATSGANTDDTYTFTLAEETEISVVLDWDAGNGRAADLDLWVVDAPFAVGVCTARTANHPESIASCTLAPGVWHIWVENYDAAHGGSQAVTNYNLRIDILE